MHMLNEKDICREYRMAKSPCKQVKILAELNCCSKNTILSVLKRNGLYNGKIVEKPKKQPVPRRPKTVWTQEMTDTMLKLRSRGYMPSDIGELLGIEGRVVTAKLNNMRRGRKKCV